MTSVQKRHRPGSVALSPAEHRASAIRDLFRLYADHDAFREALVGLARDHRAALSDLSPHRGHSFAWVESRSSLSGAVAAYVTAVRALAVYWGLDRVGAVPLPHAATETLDPPGLDAVHQWCELAFHDAEETGSSFGIGQTLSSLDPGVDPTVRIGETVYIWFPDDEPRSDAELPIPEGLRPHFDWHMRSYLTGARTRILKRLSPRQATELDAELDRIRDDHEALGYRHPDTETRFQTYLDWTFQRLALRRAVADIAADAGTTEKYCRTRLSAMQERLGIDAFPKAQRKRETRPRLRNTPR